MPMYEYVCAECGHNFETLVTASTVAHCPKCASGKLDQQFSAFAVGSVKGKGQFGKSASSPSRSGGSAGACGSCGNPDGPGSCRS